MYFYQKSHLGTYENVGSWLVQVSQGLKYDPEKARQMPLLLNQG